MEEILRSGGIENATQEARWLAEAADADSDAIALAERRIAGEPLQYLTGIAGFRRLELDVGPGALIPRPETEMVAERAMELLARDGTLIDIGTGSGAIALSVADERPDARVLATDVSAEALEWARRNRDKLGLDVELVRGSLFENVPDETRRHVDVVVSNPPYVSQPEKVTLPLDVLEHEPHVALFAGSTGLEIIHPLVEEARSWLRSDGWIVLEIAPWLAEEVTGVLRSLDYSDVGVRRDLVGRDRIVEGRIL
ncbi:MAG: peptide chain release factor N(5)-glutamine methyltransferase [Actinomycetota bacterium]